MITGVDNVIRFLRDNNLDHWKVKIKDTDNGYIFQSIENQAFEDNVKRFRSIMEVSQAGNFSIIGYPVFGINKGNYFENFSNLTNIPAIGNIQNNPINNVLSEDEFERKASKLIQKALEDDRIARRIEQLENRNKELEDEIKTVNAPMNRIAQRIEPFIGQGMSFFAQKMFPTKTLAISGTGEQIKGDEQNSEHNMNEETIKTVEERIQEACQKWGNADVEFLEVIEFLAEFASSGQPLQTGMPFTYEQVKGMIFPKA